MLRHAAYFVLVFVGGFAFGKLHPALSDIMLKLQVQASRLQTLSESQDILSNLSFHAAGIDENNIEEIRGQLERKIYGQPVVRSKPQFKYMTLEGFRDNYLNNLDFHEEFLETLEQNRRDVIEISGSFPELAGYNWKTVLMRNDGSATRRLFIFHQGHDGGAFDFERSVKAIRSLIDAGYDVLVASMPGIGWNRLKNVRVKTWDGDGFVTGLHENRHELFELIDTGTGHYIKFFVEPVVASIDAAISLRDYSTITMAGESGGGWTTTLVAAMDSRIDYSISFSGTLPFFARHKSKDLGDVEQFSSAFYRSFSYPKLYELASAAAGKHRVHYQIFNTRDYCCFDGESVATLRRYHAGRDAPAHWDFRIHVFDGGGHGFTSETFAQVVEWLEEAAKDQSVSLAEETAATR